MNRICAEQNEMMIDIHAQGRDGTYALIGSISSDDAAAIASACGAIISEAESISADLLSGVENFRADLLDAIADVADHEETAGMTRLAEQRTDYYRGV